MEVFGQDNDISYFIFQFVSRLVVRVTLIVHINTFAFN